MSRLHRRETVQDLVAAAGATRRQKALKVVWEELFDLNRSVELIPETKEPRLERIVTAARNIVARLRSLTTTKDFCDVPTGNSSVKMMEFLTREVLLAVLDMTEESGLLKIMPQGWGTRPPTSIYHSRALCCCSLARPRSRRDRPCGAPHARLHPHC
jgi:hypothetical protein